MRGSGLLLILIIAACTQSVHVRTNQRVSNVVIDGVSTGPVTPEGKDVVLPVKFGPASYSIYDGNRLIANNNLPRNRIDAWTYGLSVGGAMVFAPTLGFLSALAVNPSWFFAPTVFLHGGSVGSFWAYLAQTASVFTFPAASLGFLMGLLPLVGLLYAERLPDIVLLR